MRNEPQKQRTELVADSINTVQDLVARCPNPTQGELRKILAIQGSILNQVGLDLLSLAGKGSKLSTKQLNLALKALAASREALKASAGIRTGNQVPIPVEGQDVD